MTKVLLCCLVAWLCITNIVYSLEIEEIVESDLFISNLLSQRMGTDSRYKSLLQIQDAAYRMSEKRLTVIDKELRNNLMKMLKIASKAKNIEKVNELIGKLLYIIFKMENKKSLETIISTFRGMVLSKESGKRKRRNEPTSDELFDPLYEELIAIEGGVTLLFSVDTTGSMRQEIDESKEIATDIVNEPRYATVDYVLSPFNDPGTGPVIYRTDSQRHLITTDIDGLPSTGGGDCPELSFKGMQEALDFGPRRGSSMFVFTDAAPKDGTTINVQTLLDTAAFDDVKISFFLNKNPCGSTEAINTYYEIAKDSGGAVFVFKTGSTGAGRKRRALASSFSPLVESSLRGSSMIKRNAKPVVKGNKPITLTTEKFDIDDTISFVTVMVTAPKGSPKSVTLLDAAGVTQEGKTETNAIVYNIDNPIAGEWQLTFPDSYSYSVSVAFKSPIAIDVKYFFPPNLGQLTLISRPMRDMETDMLINVVGGDQVELSSLNAEIVDSNGKRLNRLRFIAITNKGGLKLKVKFTPPEERYRVKVTGKTRRGYKFERTTNQLSKAALFAFKTIKAGFEHSVVRGSTGNQILNFAYVKTNSIVTAKFNVHAKHGKITSVRGGTGSQRFRRRKVVDIKYDAPQGSKYEGKTDHITIDVDYAGEITTHRLSVLLL